MGAEAQCRVTLGRESSDGNALLETNELIFRGDFRLKIAFRDITRIEAKDGRLAVTFIGGTATFHIGDKAAAWADKIRNPKSLIDKLGVKTGHRVVVLGMNDAAFLAQLAARTTDVSTRPRKDADAIFFCAEALPALDRLAKLREYIKRAGMIWTVTPKGKTGIKDTEVMAAGKRAGLVDVKIAAFSATHSATKFVIPKAQR